MSVPAGLSGAMAGSATSGPNPNSHAASVRPITGSVHGTPHVPSVGRRALQIAQLKLLEFEKWSIALHRCCFDYLLVSISPLFGVWSRVHCTGI